MESTGWWPIDLTRTRGWEERDRDDDELATVDGWAAWARSVGLVDEAMARRALAEAAAHPGRAADGLARVHDLRSAVRAVLIARALERPAPDGPLEELNGWLARASQRRRLEPCDGADGSLCWTWAPPDAADVAELTLPVAWSAAELLTGDQSDRIRLCAADDCGWIFLDRSRNRSRRWCDMGDCGNRAKVRRFRRRQRGSGSG